MRGLIAIFLLKAGGEILVLLRDFGPLFVPAFEIEKLHPPRDTANIRIRVIGGNFHAHFQLSAAREALGRVKHAFRLFSLEYIAACFIGHDQNLPLLRIVFLFAPVGAIFQAELWEEGIHHADTKETQILTNLFPKLCVLCVFRGVKESPFTGRRQRRRKKCAGGCPVAALMLQDATGLLEQRRAACFRSLR